MSFKSVWKVVKLVGVYAHLPLNFSSVQIVSWLDSADWFSIIARPVIKHLRFIS